MKILIITSCTGEKKYKPKNQLMLSDFRNGPENVRLREAELKEYLLPAGEMYTGQQHLRLMRGVQGFRERKGAKGKIDLWILSAGYGLIPEDRNIAPYESTFQGMKAKEVRNLADMLNVPTDFRNLVSRSYDLELILLGESYLKVCNLDKLPFFGGPTLLFCGAGMAQKLPSTTQVIVVPLSNPEARRFSCGLIALKGEIAARLLSCVGNDWKRPSEFIGSEFDVLTILEEAVSTDRHKKSSNEQSDKEESRSLPAFLPRKNPKMLYFIPEWDDRVDPDYDFATDGITPHRDPYTHDEYAHELYGIPNYDGLLVSKSVIEKNKRKRNQIEKLGIHTHLRVPRNFPVMGDCGAFNYVLEDNPPYETKETLDFYQTLDFDYGVSVDHLILPQLLKRRVFAMLYPDGREERIDESKFERFKEQGYQLAKSRSISRDFFDQCPRLAIWEEKDLSEGKRRWEMTLRNAEEFITNHKRLGCSFTPMAGCQGWDVESQVEMFRQQQEMGYSYIALGGLVRSKTAEILEVLEGISRFRRPNTKIHIFGVARPEAIRSFSDLGVNSIDSARFLRQAWLSATSNYYSGDVDRFVASLQNGGTPSSSDQDELDDRWRYAAIRIPPLQREGGGTLTAKASKVINNGRTLNQLQTEEEKALNAVRAFDGGELGLDKTLATICAYDELMGGDSRNASHYRRVLEDKPWRSCPCRVCKDTGIDVIIFRRNNRNRRRGFHNTWWFFQFFKRMTNGMAP